MKGKIFNAQEVQSILNGSKVMFREVVKKQNEIFLGGESGKVCWHKDLCPYQVGQKIFVKESFDYREHYSIGNYDHYTAWKKRPASKMKQKHSRITLEITDVKVERLAEISKEDAIKEGATSRPNCHGYANRYEGWCMNWNKVGEASKWASNRKTLSESDVCMGSAQYAFGNFWNATHKKLEEKWEANPWVFAYEFEIINN